MKYIFWALTLVLSSQFALAASICTNTFLKYERDEYVDIIDHSLFDVKDAPEAIRFEIEESRKLIAAIKSNPEAPSFENTILPLGKPLKNEGIVETLIEVLSDAYKSEEQKAAEAEVKQLQTEFFTEYVTDQKLFARIESVWQNRDKFKLDEADYLLLKATYEGFLNNGVSLSGAKKERFQELNNKLTELQIRFSDTETNYEANVFLTFTKEELQGVSERDLASFREAAESAAKEVFEQSLESINALHNSKQKSLVEYWEKKTGVNILTQAKPKEASDELQKIKTWYEESYNRILHQYKNDSKEYRVYANYVDAVTVLTYADSPKVREAVSEMIGAIAQTKKYDNRPLVQEIVATENEISQLLGFETTAHRGLTTKMAESPETVIAFLTELGDAALPKAKQELAELERFAREKGFTGAKLKSSDRSYYAEKYLQENFNLNENVVKEYFEYSNVQKTLFELVEQLYDVKFVKRPDIRSYDPETFTYEIQKEGKIFAAITFDIFMKKNKSSGAWMNQVQGSYQKDGRRTLAQANLNLNLKKPKPAKNGKEAEPVLMTIDQVVTLFHEMGHALHAALGKSKHASQSGTQVPRDVVELPSQFLEEYVFVPEVLSKMAKHYKTGESLPAETLKNIKEAEKYNGALALLRQIKFSLIDYAYFYKGYTGQKDLVAFENEVTAKYTVGESATHAMGPKFGHIMLGGYTAGYYSYKWAEVLSTHAFSVFEREGVMNPEVVQRWYDNVLSVGGSRELNKAYEDFAGEKPSIEPLLRRAGVIE